MEVVLGKEEAFTVYIWIVSGRPNDHDNHAPLSHHIDYAWHPFMVQRDEEMISTPIAIIKSKKFCFSFAAACGKPQCSSHLSMLLWRNALSDAYSD